MKLAHLFGLAMFTAACQPLPLAEPSTSLRDQILKKDGLTLVGGLLILVLLSLAVTLWAVRRWK